MMKFGGWFVNVRKKDLERLLRLVFNPLIPTLKPQSNGPLDSNTVIGTLAIDG